MTKDHITFAQLSDFHDEEISTVDERDYIVNHIDECKSCSVQYTLLRSTIQLTSQLGKRQYLYRDFPLRTMEIVRSKRRKKMFMKAMPAIAASCVIVFGAAIYTTQTNVNNSFVANNNSVQNETEKVVGIIRDNKASITQINESFIEGEVTVEEFRKLRNKLGFRKVLYRVVSKNGSMNKGFVDTSKWRSDIENVGFGNNGYGQNVYDNNFGVTEKVVRFRIIK